MNMILYFRQKQQHKWKNKIVNSTINANGTITRYDIMNGEPGKYWAGYQINIADKKHGIKSIYKKNLVCTEI
jgi:hypothetical protein